MFTRLFAESGLSLDRLKALVEVGASGSIAKASTGDPVRQSQYSRQIKELEDFFQTRLVERHGKGVRLTAAGRELARISRFFILGLSNFQRGCLAEQQTFRIGASATVNQHLLLPVLADAVSLGSGPRFVIETLESNEIERRLHDLTLDFGVAAIDTLSRPLQLQELGTWWLRLWVPAKEFRTERAALKALEQSLLPLAVAHEVPEEARWMQYRSPAHLSCDSFLDAAVALSRGGVGAFLPDFLRPEETSRVLRVDLPVGGRMVFAYGLAWNPRLMRLNVHAGRTRDSLFASLKKHFHSLERY